jgi:hypothetical protein
MTPLHTLAVCLLLFVCVALPLGIAAMHWHESAQGMTPDQTQAACDARAARCDAHWDAVDAKAREAVEQMAAPKPTHYTGPERRSFRAMRKEKVA